MTKDELVKKCENLEKENNHLKKEMKDIRSERDKFRKQVNHLEDESNKNESRQEQYKKSYDKLVARNRELQQFIKRYRNAFTSFMQSVQGSLVNAVELEAVYFNDLNNKGGE